MKRKQIHILVGCADARDLSQIQLDAVEKITTDYQHKGIEIELHVIRAAGSFITPDVVMDIKRTFEQVQRHEPDPALKMEYYVHIQTHGHLTEDSNDHYISHVHDLHIVDNSPLNCGMLHASTVGVEIEQLLVNEGITYVTEGVTKKIANDTDIKEMLHDVYAYEGYLAGDWIRSIDLLRTHPRHQRTVLERYIDSDPELKMLHIRITCGIMDYAIHSLIRVDDGVPAVPFWDDVQQEVRGHAENERKKSELLINQSQKQKPYAGLLSLSDPKMSSRIKAANHYLKLKEVDFGGEYVPNTIFNITGSSFDIPHTPFGPYVVAGFYYAVVHLKLTDWMVMGYDSAQTGRMVQKVLHDPIMSLVVRKWGVNLIKLNLAEMA